MPEETIAQQSADFDSWNKGRCPANPDAIKPTAGPLGAKLNPIPVNGMLGAFSYLQRLRTQSGSLILFHRVRTGMIEGVGTPLDLFEYVSLDGTSWGYLWLSLYHRRRTAKTPPLFTLIPLDSCDDFMKLATKWVWSGVNSYVENFPAGVVEKIRDIHAENLQSKDKAERLVKPYRDALSHINRPELGFNKKHIACFEMLKSIKQVLNIVDGVPNKYEGAFPRKHNWLGFTRKPYFQTWSELQQSLLNLLSFDLNNANQAATATKFLMRFHEHMVQVGDFDLAMIKSLSELGGQEIDNYRIHRYLVEQGIQKHERN